MFQAGVEGVVEILKNKYDCLKCHTSKGGEGNAWDFCGCCTAWKWVSLNHPESLLPRGVPCEKPEYLFTSYSDLQQLFSLDLDHNA